jgi:hypothetical protein
MTKLLALSLVLNGLLAGIICGYTVDKLTHCCCHEDCSHASSD